jgi:UDP-2,4-diacetamido-2,4,6-trideoxy-beta-L-altropyranose hydrolase
MQLERGLPNLLLRADADPAQGAGHVMRCLALAESWHREGGQVTLLSSRLNPALRKRTETLGIDLAEIPMPHPDTSDLRTSFIALEKASRESIELPWVVLDGYHFDTAYQSLFRSAGCRLMVIDDTAHLLRYDADIILNHGLDAQRLTYNCAPDTLMLLGTRFALLRSEFQCRRGIIGSCPDVACKVLVTLGGSDAENITLKIIEALEQISTPDLEIKVVVGPLNPYLAQLQQAMASLSPRFCLETSVTDTAPLMAWADLAVAAGGTTSWELAFMKVPALIFILADNQAAAAKALDGFGTARCLGRPGDLTPEEIADAISCLMQDKEKRQRMSKRGDVLIDGRGVERVLEVMLGGGSDEPFRLRAASQEDMLLLWQWANDPVTRRNSFVRECISWTAHEAWCAERMASPDTSWWILEFRHVPVGQIRYDRSDTDTAQIYFSIAPAYRGRNLSTQILRLTADVAGQELGVRIVEGTALVENRASSHAFVGAGFDVIGEKSIAGRACFLFRHSCLPLRDGEFNVALQQR